MAPDFADDWETLRPLFRTPDPPDTIGHLVYLQGEVEVSPRIPIVHHAGDPEHFNITWKPAQAASVDRARVLVGEEVVWERDIGRVVLVGDTLNLDLSLSGIRKVFDQAGGPA